MELLLAFSDLLAKPHKNIFPDGKRIIVEVISPEGENVYRFEKAGDEIPSAYENPSEEDIAWLKKDRLIG